jgi:hypothetical protein
MSIPTHDEIRVPALKLLKEKGVLTDKKAVWLIDFWGKKTVEGLLFMPATRHILIHLNESFEAKKRSAKA